MKKILAVLLLVPTLVFAKAEPVSFDFVGVSLVTFGQATFKSIMRRDFVISPEVLSSDRKITISVKNIDAADVPRFVEKILLQQGIATTLNDGVYYLDRVQPDAKVAQQRDVEQPVLTNALKSPSVAAGMLFDSSGMPKNERDYVPSRNVDDLSQAYYPKNRPSEFMASVVSAAFGRQAVILAGSQVVLTGSKAQLVKMRGLLDELDVLPKMVDVSASWVEVTQNNGAGRGISLIANVLGAKFGASLGSVNSGSAVSLKNTNFELVIDALNTDSRFNQVSNSRIVGEENLKMNLTVGDEAPTVSSSGKDNAGNLVQNIVYRPSGVIIDVLPKVLGGGKINMAIDGQISSFKATATGVSGSPTLIKRQVKTVVTVSDGEVLLIGGLNDMQKTNSTAGFAFLPASWSLKSSGTVQTDLVLILSAKVAQK